MNDEELDLIDLSKPAGIVTKLIRDIKSKKDMERAINAAIEGVVEFKDRVKKAEEMKQGTYNENVNHKSVDSVLLAQQIKDEVDHNEI